MDKMFYSINEVATLMGVSRKTVRRIIATGKLKIFRPSPRTIRIPADDLQHFIDTHTWGGWGQD